MKDKAILIGGIGIAIGVATWIVVLFGNPDPAYITEQNIYSVQGKDSIHTIVRYIRKPGYTLGSTWIYEKKSVPSQAESDLKEAQEFIIKHKEFNE